MKMVANVVKEEEETKKGPWTEQEDLQLVCFVRLFGERRWDFLAKVSGLNRTGKSCRLRWVNYLHPGLKRGRMTPQEEQLVLELHSKWGNRWSRIARRLPGRTDNEIKNYWRTHTRKTAQERKRSTSPSSSLGQPPVDVATDEKRAEDGTAETVDGGVKVYPMDQIWNEIETSESIDASSFQELENEEGCSIACPPMASSLPWDYHEELNTFTPLSLYSLE